MLTSKYTPEEINEIKIKLKRMYPQLTAADLSSTVGKEMIMLSLVAYKLRKTRQQFQDIIDGL
ncbi:MAG: hypothetical protein KQI35_17410 [Bacteroidetes bacterium]|nr:hypothetical protein [Bacteroidota bacterium]